MTEDADNWSIYIIEASDTSLYTGVFSHDLFAG